jgi:hypothetical protein
MYVPQRILPISKNLRELGLKWGESSLPWWRLGQIAMEATPTTENDE